jgi:hypothetical protein
MWILKQWKVPLFPAYNIPTMLLRPALASGLLVVLSHAALAFAPSPTVLTVKYKDQMLPVVRVIDTDPVVQVDGKEKRIRTEPLYLTQPAPGFADTSVDIVKTAMGGMELQQQIERDQSVANPSQGPRFGTSYFEGSMKARQTLKGGFAVVTIYSPYDFVILQKDPKMGAHAEVIVHELPTLPAGKTVAVKFTAAIPNGKPHLTYCVQLFDHQGREVVTNQLQKAWAYYHQRDLVTLRDAVTKYIAQFSGANHGLVPVLMPHPLLPDGIEKPADPAAAILDVSAEGLVTHVELEGIPLAAAQHATAEALGGWMFLPQLESGTPVATKVKVPLRF